MGLKLTPLVLEEGVGDDEQELAAPVNAGHNVLHQGDPHLKVSLVDTDPQPWLMLLHLGQELVQHPGLLPGPEADKHVIGKLRGRELLLGLPGKPSTPPEKPVGNVEPPPVGHHQAAQQQRSHDGKTDQQAFREKAVSLGGRQVWVVQGVGTKALDLLPFDVITEVSLAALLPARMSRYSR